MVSPSVHSSLEQQIAARVLDEIKEPVVSCLLRPRFVVLLDGGAPISVSLACEFDYHGETYHYGLAGPGTPWDGSAAARAPLAPLRMGRPTARPQRVPDE